MADLWAEAERLPYDRPEDAFDAGEYFGLAVAAEALKALPGHVQQLPGFVLATAAIDARCQSARANMAIKSLRLAAKRRVDINTHLVAQLRDGLAVLPMDLAQRAEADR